MALNKLSQGAAPNDNTGTPLRTGAGYINNIITLMFDTVTGGIAYLLGNVGIGVALPTSPLHVAKDHTGYVVNINNNGGAGGQHGLLTNTASTGNVIYEASSAGVTRVKIEGAGYIYLNDRVSIPPTPTTGGYFHSVAGALYWTGSSGTTTLIAPA